MFGVTLEKYIIVGCGRFGSSLAGLLSESGRNVVMIDREKESFRRLPPSYSGLEVVGDGIDPGTYAQARMQRGDTLIATTDNDNVNCMIAEMGKKVFHLPAVFARLTDPSKERLLDGLGIRTIYPVSLSIREFSRESGIPLRDQEARS